MDFKCKGDWDSWTKQTFPPTGNPNDGLLVIGKEKGNGKFKGKHKKKKKDDAGKEKDVEYDLDGQCKHDPNHEIKFKTKEGFSYFGKISEKEIDGKKKDVAEGTRSISKDRKKTDEDWVAVKVT